MMMMQRPGQGRGGPAGGGPTRPWWSYGDGHGQREKASDFRGSMGKLFRYMGRYKIAVVVAVLFAIASTFGLIYGPKILGNATTSLFQGVLNQISGTGSIDFDYIGGILIQVLILYTFSAVCGFIQGLDYGKRFHKYNLPTAQRYC